MDALLFHPKIVHLPMALSVLMPLLASGLLLAWIRGFLPRRTWLVAVVFQTILLGSSMVAMRTGEDDEERVEAVVSETPIEAHEEAAEAFTWAAAAALLLFGCVGFLGSETNARRAAFAATAASLVVLALGYRVGHAGGELVYRHGAASAWTSSGTPAASGSAVDADIDDD